MAQPPTRVIVSPGPGEARVAAQPATSHDEEGIATLVGRAVDNARELASAEVALVKAKVSERVGAYESAALFFAIAAVLALSAVTALLVGLILSLATLVGPGGATAIVVIGTFVLAGILALVGKNKLAPAKGVT